MKKVVIVGGGFAGLNAAKMLGGKRDLEVTLIDRRNHHLFQPLLYQVAMAGLSPAEIAQPIRSILSRYRNISVLHGEVENVDLGGRQVATNFGPVDYDFLLLACGATHSYFGNDSWQAHAPGLKTVAEATDIRRRVLTAFEQAERCTDPVRRKALMTFVVVGGGPTGVELAGALGEMSRFTLARDFRTIDPKQARVILIEAGSRILAPFSGKQAARASRDLEGLGVQIWTASRVTEIDAQGISIGEERIEADTVMWAAGVQGAALGQALAVKRDRSGRIRVEPDLSVSAHPEVFVAGDFAHFAHERQSALPGIAAVAMQQGRFVGQTILGDLADRPRKPFVYTDKGQMATIGRSRAIVEVGRWQFAGLLPG
jgi:NADH:ubiquinone reductase (H+-translocating)